MEKLHNLMERICSFDNLYEAYISAAKGKGDRKEVIEYAFRLEENLFQIQKELKERTYRVGRYREFYIKYPKPRLVMALGFKDRIVQWAIYRQLDPYVDKRFYYHSYGCRKNKGTLAAAECLMGWIRKISRKSDAGDWRVIKGDISKYFYRVDHAIMMDCYREICDEEDFLWLMQTIIDNGDVPFGLPEGMDIYECPRNRRLYEVGQPIGNLTSQETANIYLDKFDQWCKHEMKIRYYVRYMDDFCAIVRKEEAEEIKQRMAAFLREKLKLTMSRKSRILPISQGIEFVGFRVSKHGLRMRKKTTKHIRQAVRHICKLYAEYAIPFERARDSLICYMGMTTHVRARFLSQWIEENAVLRRNENPPAPKAIPEARDTFYRISDNRDGTCDVWLTPGTAVPRFDSLTGRTDYGFEILAVRGVEPYDGLEEDIRRRYTDWIKSAETIEI